MGSGDAALSLPRLAGAGRPDPSLRFHGAESISNALTCGRANAVIAFSNESIFHFSRRRFNKVVWLHPNPGAGAPQQTGLRRCTCQRTFDVIISCVIKHPLRRVGSGSDELLLNGFLAPRTSGNERKCALARRSGTLAGKTPTQKASFPQQEVTSASKRVLVKQR